jgi:hexosaminidase
MKYFMKWINFLTIAGLAYLLVNCSTPVPMDLSKESIIPKPRMVTTTGSSFELTESSTILSLGGPDTDGIAAYLAGWLQPATGFTLKTAEDANKAGSGDVFLTTNIDDPELGTEGYELEILEEKISLKANTTEGLFRGIQTLRQLFPARIESKDKQQGPWLVATGTIRDYPEYGYRGAMLDVARHFFGVEDVKRYIDLLALYKINHLHLHLTDDQGWRIEIKSWPELTRTGGSTEVDGGEGGYYTQKQYKELVSYAADRFITIVPEIDMPGHTNAALASYAVLNCDNKKRALYTGTEVGFSTLCTRKDTIYRFVDDVISELAEITPGPYIHVGGDESLVTKKADYIYFIERVSKIISSHGKTMIGWEEIAQAKLPAGTIAQHWHHAEYPLEAVKQGVKVLMSPAHKAYVDMKYDSTTRLGLSWAGFIEVDTAYLWDPATMVDGIDKKNIIGIEAPLWTETVTTMDEIEYMAFPRMAGYAEIGWTPASARDWAAYKKRLAGHGKRLEALEVDFYRSPLVQW